MIGYISGLLIDKDEKTVLVLAQNIGYKIHVTIDWIAKAKMDQKVQLYIHTAVREDDISLYGFAEKAELAFYQKLIGVSGIGPKMAMDILSTPMHLTKQAIVSADTALLTQIKGLGKKTAERLILELKNKVDLTGTPAQTVSIDDDAVTALVGLGYEKYQVIKLLADRPKDLKETEDVIRYFLKQA